MKKGFTLIELMAVIIVLGIVAVIAYPMLGDTIENSKKKTFASSLEGIYRTVDVDSMNNEYERDSKYTYTNGVLTKVKANGSDITPKVINVKGGIKDGNGTVIIDKDGNIIIAIENDKYCGYTTSSAHNIQVGTGSCSEYAGSENWTDDSCFGFDSSTGTITSYDESCGVDVVIPRIINGVTVKHIGNFAFYNGIGDNVIEMGFIIDRESDICVNNEYGYCGYTIPYDKAMELNLEISEEIGIHLYSITSSSYKTCINNSQEETIFRYGEPGFYNIQTASDGYIACVYDYDSILDFSYNPDSEMKDKSLVLTDIKFEDNSLNNKKLINIDNLYMKVKNKDEIKTTLTIIVYDSPIPFDSGTTSDHIVNLDLSSATELLSIGSFAFYENNIENINFDGVTKLKRIGEYAFFENPLTSIDLSNLTNLTKIERGTFLGCSLSSLDLSGLSKLTAIYDEAFGFNDIINLNISNLSNLTTIGKGTFRANIISSIDFSGLTNLKIIDEQAFEYNEISNLELSGLSNLTTIGEAAFYENNLTTIDLSGLSNLTTIGYGAFTKKSYSNKDLTTIYTNGKTFDWGTIINGSSGYNFVTGTVTNSTGNVTVTTK